MAVCFFFKCLKFLFFSDGLFLEHPMRKNIAFLPVTSPAAPGSLTLIVAPAAANN